MLFFLAVVSFRRIRRLGFAMIIGFLIGDAVADHAVADGSRKYRIRSQVDPRFGEEGVSQSEHFGADGPDHEADDEEHRHANAEQEECPFARHDYQLPPWSLWSRSGVCADRGPRLEP